MARSCFCAMGGKRRTPTRLSQAANKIVCPIHGTFLFLRYGWETMNPNPPLSICQQSSVPHPWHVLVFVPWVGNHEPYPTPTCALTAINPSANPAALPVERKFTPSLSNHPLRSSVAPSKLSKKNPNTAPPPLIQNIERSPRSAHVPIPATIPAAIKPASVPAALTAPSVPGSATPSVVIMRGCPPSTCPISDETVSAAASASAASITARIGTRASIPDGENQCVFRSHPCTNSDATSAAIPRFA